VDPKLFCELSQINGNDCWCMYEHEEGQYSQVWIDQNMFYDMLRSFEDRPIFNSENHIIKDRERKVIPWQHIRTALWQGAIHGQAATTIWVWERTYDEKSDSAGSIMHRPLCVRAVGETGLDLMRFSDEVASLQKVEPTVGLLYSIPSIVYREAYLDELKNTYEALNFMGRRVAFVPGDHLSTGTGIPDVLFVTGATHVKEETADGLSEFSRRGGRLFLVGDHNLERNEHDLSLEMDLGEPASKIPGGLPPVDLRSLIQKHLDLPEVRPVRPSGETAWGIEWLSTPLDDCLLINAVNLLRGGVKVKWLGADDEVLRLTDLFGQRELDAEETMSPLEPLLAGARP
jgi:hypothetical protein